MRYKLSTLNDLEGHRQPVPSAILATAGLLFIVAAATCCTVSWQRCYV